jgi:hypothetical protein
LLNSIEGPPSIEDGPSSVALRGRREGDEPVLLVVPDIVATNSTGVGVRDREYRVLVVHLSGLREGVEVALVANPRHRALLLGVARALVRDLDARCEKNFALRGCLGGFDGLGHFHPPCLDTPILSRLQCLVNKIIQGSVK